MNIPFKQSPNFSLGKLTKRGYVLHQSLGNFKGDVEWLSNANRVSRSSAHYVIGRNEGEVVQLVKDSDTSWHAGNISNPAIYAKTRMLRNADGTYVNPNAYLIGIEFTSRFDYDKDGRIEPEEIDITDWQYRCMIEIMKNNQTLVPIKQDMILLSHKEICDYKSDDTIFIRNGLLARLFPEQTVKIDCPVSKVDRVLAYMKSI